MYKLIAVILLCTLLLCGCNQPYPIPETRPYEEIQSSGITAEDVLALYDLMALDFFKANLRLDKKLYSSDVTLEEIETATAQFGSITSTYDDYYLCWSMYQFNERDTYASNFLSGSDDTVTVNNVFQVRMSNNGVLLDKKGADTCGIVIPYHSFLKVVDAFGFSVAHEARISSYVDVPYEAFTIDRKLIEGANTEQLWALYDMCQDMWQCNREGTVPKVAEPYQMIHVHGSRIEQIIDYDTSHRIIKRATYTNDDQNSLEEYWIYTYLDNGWLTMTKYDMNDIKQGLVIYDQFDVEQESFDYYENGNLRCWKQYHYSDSGRLSREMSHYYQADGRLHHSVRYDYDESGNRTAYFIYEHVYDRNGQLSYAKRFKVDSDGTYSTDVYDIVYYDVNGNLIP